MTHTIQKHRTYATTSDFQRAVDSWGQLTFGFTLKEPHIYSEDLSFDWEAHGLRGTERCYSVEVSEGVRHGARVDYIVARVMREDPLPLPPKELEIPYTWINAPTWDEDHVPALPMRVDLWCHLELESFELKVINESVVASATYTYQYSSEPVLAENQGD